MSNSMCRGIGVGVYHCAHVTHKIKQEKKSIQNNIVAFSWAHQVSKYQLSVSWHLHVLSAIESCAKVCYLGDLSFILQCCSQLLTVCALRFCVESHDSSGSVGHLPIQRSLDQSLTPLAMCQSILRQTTEPRVILKGIHRSVHVSAMVTKQINKKTVWLCEWVLRIIN